MRKLDKTKMLATAYKQWLDKLEAEGKSHPPYKSSHEFYIDVVANLLWIQDGLCAYTEQFLFDSTELGEENWIEGKYGKSKFEFFGHLEHYDESLKESKGWLWSNLFVAHSDINTKLKGSKPVRYVLKPDADSYDPFYLLQYDFKSHRFLPNTERELDLQNDILHDINVLGLNYQSVIQDRKAHLNILTEEVRLHNKTLVQARESLREYFTAFEMIVKELKLELVQ